MIEPAYAISLLKTALYMLALMLVFRYIFPPLHLINDEDKKAKEKKLEHIMNLDNMNWKQRAKMFSIMLLVVFSLMLASQFKNRLTV